MLFYNSHQLSAFDEQILQQLIWKEHYVVDRFTLYMWH